MQNKQTKQSTVPEGEEAKADITSLPKMEMYAVLGLELSQRIYEKLGKIEDSVDILAREKARELGSEESKAK